MVANRVDSLSELSNKTLKSTPFATTDDFEWEVRKYALEAAVRDQTQENYRLKKELSKMRNNEKSDREKLRDLESEESRVVIKFSSLMAGAMNYVASYVEQNADRIAEVHFGLADYTFRFVFVSKSRAFDWDLSDDLGTVWLVLATDYKEIPFSVLNIPITVVEDVGAILAHELGVLKRSLGDRLLCAN